MPGQGDMETGNHVSIGFFGLTNRKKKVWQPKQKDARIVLPETCGPARLQLLAPDLCRCSSRRWAHSHCVVSADVRNPEL